MFDISKDQLLRLSDVDLRELVARLCEAELSRAGAPVSAVRWGGAQTAPDGGLDVEILVKGQEFAGDFVPRAWTGIQVKKSSMPAGEIAAEMSPKGVLRPIFPELAIHNGCYIIVSLADDPAGTNLGNREEAMQAQIESIKDQGDLRIGFYGRGHLANWLRQHPGVQLWVREKLGLSLSGWRPFGRWSTTPPGVEDDLICEAGVTIALPGERDKLGILQGINRIRELIRSSGKAVRIVGLSGVGKSRIVQALFEETVGDEPLDRHLAIYADLGETLNPSAREVLDRLAAEGRSAIMVLDNCSSDAHNQFASQVTHSPNLHLVTVEYDIRVDKPEVTSVVRVDAEGPEIAEILIERRYPDLGQVNTRRIAELSGGNARLALALAGVASEAKESLSDFSDEQLFDRLFYQRGERDSDLAMSAEILALVYSFSVSADEDGVGELATLAGLLGRDRLLLYRKAQTLVNRHLAQKRGNWRAVLPHALSNRLAKRALENIPVDDILNTFQGLPNHRLLKSFGKRLGYLHDHEAAQDIVKSWLSPDGLLHDLHLLNEDRIQLLLNVAPTAPEDVLSAIEAQDETFFSRGNPRLSTFVDLLAKIAYEAELFERCVNLLAKFALTEREGENRDSIQDRLFGLFSLHLSGTEADPDAREDLTRRFLMSDQPNEQRLGLGMLRAALQSHHWFAVGNFEFGARPRSYGYQPKTYEEQNRWFMRFVALAREIATGEDGHLSTQVRTLLAGELRGLWDHPGLREALVDLAMSLNEQQPWLEGWRAVRSIKYYDYRRTGGTKLLDKLDEMPESERPSDKETKTYVLSARLLDKLDETLKPRRPSDEVRTYVLRADHELPTLNEEFDFDDNQSWQEANDRAAERAYDLGTVVAGEPHVMDELAQELFTAQNGYLFEFGKGVASKCNDLQGLWERLIEWLELAGDQACHSGVLNGVLKVTHNRDEPLAQKILDEAVQNRILRKFIVALHLVIPLERTGVERLLRSLDFEDTPLRQFGMLAWQRPLDMLSEADLRDLMLKMLGGPDGAEVVLDGLSMRLHVLKDDNLTLGPDLKRIALLASAALLRHRADFHYGDSIDFHLSEVLKSCMDEIEFPTETSEVFDAYLTRLRASHGYMGGIEKAVAILAEKATFRFLYGIFFDPVLEDYRHTIFRVGRDEENPLSGVSVTTLLDWCRQDDFQGRLTMISEAIYPFEKEPEGDGVVLSEQAYAIIDATQEPSTVLKNFRSSVRPNGWSGSLANIIAKRGQAFRTLLEHDRSAICDAAEAAIAQINQWEEQERRYERLRDEQREQRFE